MGDGMRDCAVGSASDRGYISAAKGSPLFLSGAIISSTPEISLSIDASLPLSRMAEIAEPLRASYAKAEPFPHVVVDNFFDPALLDRILAEFPRPGEIRWQRFDNEREIKLASAAEASFGPVTRLLLYH